jgi:signal peptidase I
VTPRLLRRARNVGLWALVATVVFLAWPAQLGGHLSLVVVSGHSMDGTYRSGDLLLTWPHTAYDTGDVVVYRVPDGEAASGLRVVHRVIANDDGHFTTQGDNRDTPDIWTPTADNVDGRPFLRLPAGGIALKWLFSPIALALVSAVCIYLVVVGKDDEAKDSQTDDSQTDDCEADHDAGSGDQGAREPEAVVPG